MTTLVAHPLVPAAPPPPPAPAPLAGPALPIVRLLGLQFHALTEPQAAAHIVNEIRHHRGGWVITPNLDHLRRFTCDPEFASYFAQADLVLCDGMPLVWAAHVQGTPLPQRVAGSDLIWSLSAAAAAQGIPVYLLGGHPGAAEAAARVLQEKFPNILIGGVECPDFGFENDPAAVDAMVERLQNAQPGIVFVALGSPKQEQLIARIRHCLPRAWWLGVGISFSFVSGDVKRAPSWMRSRGLEWVHRLYQEPRRLARRYLVDDLPFVRMLFTSALWNRLTGRALTPPNPHPDPARHAKQFMAACDWAICLGLILLAHAPLLAYGVVQLWSREAYLFVPFAWAAALLVGLIRLFGATFERPHRLAAGLLMASGTLSLVLATAYWSWSLGVMSLVLNLAVFAYRAGGFSLLRALIPAALVFLTTLPPPLRLDGQFLDALRRIALHASDRLLDAMGVGHAIAGDMIEVSGYRVAVAEAGNGINAAMACIAFAVACAMFRRRGTLHTILLVLSAVLFAVAGNAVRIALGAAVLAWFNFDLLSGWTPVAAQWIVFAPCVILILAADHLLRRAPRARPPASFNWPRVTWPIKSLLGGYIAIGLAAAVFIAPHVAWIWPGPGPSHLPPTARFTLPEQIGLWTQGPLPGDFPAQTTGPKSQFWSFTHGSSRVIIALDYPFMAYHDLVWSYQAQGWTLESRAILPDPLGGGGGAVEEARIARPGGRATLLFVLQDERGRWLVSDQSLSLKDELRRRLTLFNRVEGDPRPSYEMQALFPEDHPVTPEERHQVESLFRDIRQSLAQQLLTQLANPR